MIATSPPFAEFTLPPECEAREPAELRGVARDRVRLLVSDRARGTLAHERFDRLPDMLRPGDLLVANDSATLPAALEARHADGRTFALHVSDRVAATLWIVEPRAATRTGDLLQLPGDAVATLLAPLDERAPRLWYARVDTNEPYVEYLHAYGSPIRYGYIERAFALPWYQTVFARVPGSAEMPSAGRPFTPATLTALRERGVAIATVTLHAGVSSAEAHEPPQPERFAISPATARTVNAAHTAGRRVIAIGTTVVRALESAVVGASVVASSGRTERIVSPIDPPRVVDGVLTGLHEPRASHLDMLAAFLERGALREAYATALGHGYLWHEFGDVHLIA